MNRSYEELADPEEIQEAMEEQMSELLNQISYAPDAGNEELVEDALA